MRKQNGKNVQYRVTQLVKSSGPFFPPPRLSESFWKSFFFPVFASVIFFPPFNFPTPSLLLCYNTHCTLITELSAVLHRTNRSKNVPAHTGAEPPGLVPLTSSSLGPRRKKRMGFLRSVGYRNASTVHGHFTAHTLALFHVVIHPAAVLQTSTFRMLPAR